MSENPLIDTAEITDDGPGIEKIFIFFLTISFIRIDPGSEIHGVPASEIIETIFLFSSKLTTF